MVGKKIVWATKPKMFSTMTPYRKRLLGGREGKTERGREREHEAERERQKKKLLTPTLEH